MSRTQGKLKVRGKAGYTGHSLVDENGRSVFAIPSNGKRPVVERDANAEFCAMAWNKHDALVVEVSRLSDVIDALEMQIASMGNDHN